MDKGTRGLAFLLSVQFQAVLFLAAAWYGAEFLNEKYPMEFDWLTITIILALILIAHSFYVVFKFLIQKEKQEKNDKNRKD